MNPCLEREGKSKERCIPYPYLDTRVKGEVEEHLYIF